MLAVAGGLVGVLLVLLLLLLPPQKEKAAAVLPMEVLGSHREGVMREGKEGARR